jgi:hypothetical protein
MDAGRHSGPGHLGLSHCHRDERGAAVDRYIIERRGGFAGLKASGTIDADALDPDDRNALERILDSDEQLTGDPGADRYTYIVTREGVLGTTTREIPESVLPAAVASAVTAEI